MTSQGWESPVCGRWSACHRDKELFKLTPAPKLMPTMSVKETDAVILGSTWKESKQWVRAPCCTRLPVSSVGQLTHFFSWARGHHPQEEMVKHILSKTTEGIEETPLCMKSWENHASNKSRHTNQWNETEDPELHSHSYVHRHMLKKTATSTVLGETDNPHVKWN